MGNHGLELGLVELLVEGAVCVVDLVVAAVQVPEHPSLDLSSVGLEAISQLLERHSTIVIHVARVVHRLN